MSTSLLVIAWLILALVLALSWRTARSAWQARYWSRPPLRASSRETVEGARLSCRAICRQESPATSPREISSRSASESRNSDRRNSLG